MIELLLPKHGSAIYKLYQMENVMT